VDVRQLVGECAATIEPLVEPGVELHRDLGEVDSLYTDPERLRRRLFS